MSVLALLMELSHCATSDFSCAKRLAPIASAIVAATPHTFEQAWLARQAKYESNLFAWVANDEPRCREGWDGVCDNGKAWSLWQLHGTDRRGGTRRAAKLALGRWTFALDHCAKHAPHDSSLLACGFALLATGHRFSWSEAPKREAALSAAWLRLEELSHD